MILYPIGYRDESVDLAELIRREGDGLHPAIARRFWAWIAWLKGEVGVGDGWRPTPSPVSQASRDGESFHQWQLFASGLTAWCAIDCVVRDGPDANNSHDGMTAELAATAVQFGLHANIGIPGVRGYESWHIQGIEMDSYDAWVRAGRPDPDPDFPLPTATLPTTPEEIPEMLAIRPAHPDLNPGLFTVDGHPISAELYAELGVDLTIIDQDHAWWDEATLHKMGEPARRLYRAL